MKRMVSKKSHSWWWDSHISRKNSKWLEENLEKMDHSVKQMLKLIEEEGESFAKKAEMYYQRRPQLISHVEDFYRMYRALAERYDQVTGDLRRNIRSELKLQGSGSSSDIVSDPPSPSSVHSLEVTPETKPQPQKRSSRAPGFDFFLGSGGSSDLSRKGSDGGSVSSSSESDSDSEFDEVNEVNDGDMSSRLQQRVHELEDELHELTKRLKEQEEKSHQDCNFKILGLEEEVSAANEKFNSAETEILGLKKNLEDTAALLEFKITELSSEKKAVADLKDEIEDLKEAKEAATEQFETELANLDFKLRECKNELVNAREKFLKHKSSLELKLADLEGMNVRLKAEMESLLNENYSLEARLFKMEDVIQELKASTASSMEDILWQKSALEDEIAALTRSNSSLEAEVNLLHGQLRQLEDDKIQTLEEGGKQIAELNENLDALKNKVESLTNQVKHRDSRIIQMDQHLEQLHLEHAKLIMEMEEASRAGSDLKSKMKDLEEEVERQRIAIFDGAEGKREAIRQLCFSLEHYRDGYHQLRQLLQGHKRSAIAAK